MTLKIAIDVLAYWGMACRRASRDNYHCWTQLHNEGFVVTVIGPAGDRAEIPIPYDELAQATTPKGAIDEIIAELRKQLKVQSPLILPI